MYTKFVLLLLISSTVACQQQKNGQIQNNASDSLQRATESARQVAGNFSAQTSIKFDSVQLEKFFNEYTAVSSYKKDMIQFYKGRNFAFAWYDGKGQIEQASHLYNRIKNLSEDGLSVKIPYEGVLDSLMGTLETTNKSEQIETELLLTAFYFYYAEKVWAGMDEKMTKQIDWYLPRKKISYDKWLDSLLQSPKGFNGATEPLFRQYHLLKQFLAKYKAIEQNAWSIIKADKKSYRLDDSAAIIVDIRKRLFALDDLKADTTSNKFDANLEAAVKNFQQRNGIKNDGIIGQAMIAEMNVPVNKRIEQIIINMERSRWLPVDVKGDYLAVNIPEFTLHAYKDDSLIWDMNVVVGKSVNKTVIFSGDLKYVVFSPYWNVPASILKSEVLPGIRRNKNYLARHHMEWNGNSVRQKPGPWNSLGAVKFLFPNSFSIYLHDTPSKNLFKEDKRAFSHGCIRVAEPKKLAMYLLRYDPQWNEKAVTQAMNSGKEQYVTLKKSVPVFITYFTSWVDRQGNLNFRNDVYNRDSRLAEMIFKD